MRESRCSHPGKYNMRTRGDGGLMRCKYGADGYMHETVGRNVSMRIVHAKSHLFATLAQGPTIIKEVDKHAQRVIIWIVPKW